jgi:hypothetical protein
MNWRLCYVESRNCKEKDMRLSYLNEHDGDRPPLEAGVYRASLANVSLKTPNAGGSPYSVLVWEVLDEDDKALQRVYDRLILRNENRATSKRLLDLTASLDISPETLAQNGDISDASFVEAMQAHIGTEHLIALKTGMYGDKVRNEINTFPEEGEGADGQRKSYAPVPVVSTLSSEEEEIDDIFGDADEAESDDIAAAPVLDEYVEEPDEF